MRRFLFLVIFSAVILVLVGNTMARSGKWDAVVDFTRYVVGDTIADFLSGVGDEAGDIAAKPVPDVAKPIKDFVESLGAIESAKAERIPDYKRDRFGPAWADTDGNGCDTRNDILARDLTKITRDNRCRVLTGVLADPYTGKTIVFERGEKTSQAVQIDHIVPLSMAWQSGAWKWGDADREQFANDPLNLLAVDGPTNNAKGGRGPSRWLPPAESAHCDYAKSYVAVMTKYSLTIEDADRKALNAILLRCV